MLEVIDKGSTTEAHPAPVLFVHGAWHAAWCWDEHFLNFFAAKGYRALAVSLRGHGGSATLKPLRSLSIADYVEDVRSVADGLPTLPVVIGHSMGGFVVQKYLQSHSAPAGVPLASGSPAGKPGAIWRFMRRHPWLATKGILTGNTMTGLETPARARESLFSAKTPESQVLQHLARFQQESKRALYVDTPFRAPPRPQQVSSPLLVLGAECDGTITTEEILATATTYRSAINILPDMGHDMMLEPGWDAVAQRIVTWLEIRGL